MAHLADRFAIILHYCLPKYLLTVLAGKLASARAGRLTTGFIRWYIHVFQVNMAEAAEPDFSRYATFQDFFTRPLQPGARPLAETPFVSPADGKLTQFGHIERDQLLQAKGQSYSLLSLIGGEQKLAAAFEHGSYATIYLSPADYHRLHMPCAGRLSRMIYIPGALFSVNPKTVAHIPGLFARNERVICQFESEAGPFIMVLVGATIVASIATTWHGVVNKQRLGKVLEWQYASAEAPQFAKGEEMGRFLLGSTVVLLFPQNSISFQPRGKGQQTIRMGEALGLSITSPQNS